MVEVVYQGKTFTRNADESVLECLLRNHQDVSHSCRSGVCQTCMMQVDSSQATEGLYQSGIKPQQAAQGYFLPCKSFPKARLELVKGSPGLGFFQATLVDKKVFNSSVFSLTLSVPDNKLEQENNGGGFTFAGGQFINILKDKNCIRTYSIASATPQNDNDKSTIELHIKRYKDGKFSQWAFETLDAGSTISLQSPAGNCYYTHNFSDKSLQLFAMGTGLSPIIGILKTALANNHQPPIRLIAGSRLASELYYFDEISALAEKHPSLSVTYLYQERDAEFDRDYGFEVLESDFYEYATRNTNESNGIDRFDKNAAIFICGSESFVTKLRKKCFLAGADFKNIQADIFLPGKT